MNKVSKKIVYFRVAIRRKITNFVCLKSPSVGFVDGDGALGGAKWQVDSKLIIKIYKQ